jgi:polysaccharide pyruvyl transferase WcaK-like protein
MRHKDHAIIDGSFNTPENFMEKAAGLDIVLGTRMHACILAMLAGVPSVNVEYEFKSRELYNRLALEDLIVDILEFKADELAAKAVALLKNRDSAERRVFAGVEALRQQNAAVAEYMRKRFR